MMMMIRVIITFNDDDGENVNDGDDDDEMLWLLLWLKNYDDEGSVGNDWQTSNYKSIRITDINNWIHQFWI